VDILRFISISERHFWRLPSGLPGKLSKSCAMSIFCTTHNSMTISEIMQSVNCSDIIDSEIYDDPFVFF
jgi:hypothetical protein